MMEQARRMTAESGSFRPMAGVGDQAFVLAVGVFPGAERLARAIIARLEPEPDATHVDRQSQR
ncbi:MAG TPA: hypothetical protein VGH38_12465 [Bryobacteraceae bacterium]|jgi:predicted Rdx family selenoprotein